MHKEMLEQYSLRQSPTKYKDSYVRFSRDGRINFYNTKLIIYVYEIPCTLLSMTVPISDNGEKCKEISSQACRDFMHYLYRSVGRSFNIAYYQGACGRFCYAKGKYVDWIYKATVPQEFKDYRIRADKFYITLDGKRHFISPTLDDYHKMVKKGSPQLDDGSTDDYVYDFWDVIEYKDENNKTITAVQSP